MIADLLLGFAGITFVLADIKQAYKLFKKKKYSTKAFSKTHFKLKIFSLVLVIVAYCLLSTHIAFSIAVTQFFLNIYILYKIGGIKNGKEKNIMPIFGTQSQ